MSGATDALAGDWLITAVRVGIWLGLMEKIKDIPSGRKREGVSFFSFRKAHLRDE